MRFSDTRIQNISSQIAETLMKRKLIEYHGLKVSLVSLISRTIIKDLSFEDQIDEEVVHIIKSMKKQIPEGSAEWNSIFQQQKELLAKRFNYIL